MIDGLAADLLGAHVEGRPHRDAGLGQGHAFALERQLGQSEVGDLRFPLAGEHDVFGLDIAVDDAGLPGDLQSGGDLLQNVQREGDFEGALFLHEVSQVAALHVFLGDVFDAVRLPDHVDLDDIGMAQSARRGGLLAEAFDVVLVGEELGAEDFDRDLSTERRLLGEVDLGHASLAQPAEHAEFAELAIGQIQRRAVLAAARQGDVGHGGLATGAGFRIRHGIAHSGENR